MRITWDFCQECEDYSVRERKVFSGNGAGTLDIHMQNNEVGLTPYAMYEINLKWIKYLNVGAKTNKILRKKYRYESFDLGFGNRVLATTSKALNKKKKIKLDFIKI